MNTRKARKKREWQDMMQPKPTGQIVRILVDQCVPLDKEALRDLAEASEGRIEFIPQSAIADGKDDYFQMERARRENAVILTADKGFLLPERQEHMPQGVIVIKDLRGKGDVYVYFNNALKIIYDYCVQGSTGKQETILYLSKKPRLVARPCFTTDACMRMMKADEKIIPIDPLTENAVPRTTIADNPVKLHIVVADGFDLNALKTRLEQCMPKRVAGDLIECISITQNFDVSCLQRAHQDNAMIVVVGESMNAIKRAAAECVKENGAMPVLGLVHMNEVSRLNAVSFSVVIERLYNSRLDVYPSLEEYVKSVIKAKPAKPSTPSLS